MLPCVKRTWRSCAVATPRRCASARATPRTSTRAGARAPHRTAYRGLEVLAVYLEARRGAPVRALPRVLDGAGEGRHLGPPRPGRGRAARGRRRSARQAERKPSGPAEALRTAERRRARGARARRTRQAELEPSQPRRLAFGRLSSVRAERRRQRDRTGGSEPARRCPAEPARSRRLLRCRSKLTTGLAAAERRPSATHVAVAAVLFDTGQAPEGGPAAPAPRRTRTLTSATQEPGPRAPASASAAGRGDDRGATTASLLRPQGRAAPPAHLAATTPFPRSTQPTSSPAVAT